MEMINGISGGIGGIGQMAQDAATSQNGMLTDHGVIPFENVLRDAFAETQYLNDIAQADTLKLMLGETDNLAQVQINSLKASTMLQTTVQLTSRVVTAYKEIMQIQV